MGFVQTNVNYASEYARALAQAYPYLSYFAAIWASENSNRYKPGMGKTMYIPTVETSGAKDVLNNERFVQNAKPEVVELERKKKADAEMRIATLKEAIAQLK